MVDGLTHYAEKVVHTQQYIYIYYIYSKKVRRRKAPFFLRTHGKQHDRRKGMRINPLTVRRCVSTPNLVLDVWVTAAQRSGSSVRLRNYSCSSIRVASIDENKNSHRRITVTHTQTTYKNRIALRADKKADTVCSPEDLPETMNDRENWRERVRDIRAGSMTWWRRRWLFQRQCLQSLCKIVALRPRTLLIAFFPFYPKSSSRLNSYRPIEFFAERRVLHVN